MHPFIRRLPPRLVPAVLACAALGAAAQDRIIGLTCADCVRDANGTGQATRDIVPGKNIAEYANCGG